jgi:hypothetical protein
MQTVESIVLHSNTINKDIIFLAYCSDTQITLTSSSIKANALKIMAEYANKPGKIPITYSFGHIESSVGHCVVECTFRQGDFAVTESGEILSHMSNEESRKTPYIMAQNSAFDTAFISFMQIYSSKIIVSQALFM